MDTNQHTSYVALTYIKHMESISMQEGLWVHSVFPVPELLSIFFLGQSTMYIRVALH